MHYVLADKVKFYPQSDEIEVAHSKQKVEPQVNQLLLLLVTHSQNICTKQHMLDTIWSGRVVTDDSVRALVRKLRDALGDDVKSPRFIKTHPRVGYQLICHVQQQRQPFSLSILTDLRFLIIFSVAVVILVAWLVLFGSGPPDKDAEAGELFSVHSFS